MHFTTATVLSALAAIPLASGLGINCRGSGQCTGDGNTILTLRNQISGLNGQIGVSNGQQIMCTYNKVCVFFQNTSKPKTLADAVRGLNDLIAHNCHICGSDPTEPGNDVSQGQLTVNWVSSTNPTWGYIDTA